MLREAEPEELCGEVTSIDFVNCALLFRTLNKKSAVRTCLSFIIVLINLSAKVNQKNKPMFSYLSFLCKTKKPADAGFGFMWVIIFFTYLP
jgi:hypothetical protein